MKKCPFCAEDIQEAAIVCRYCGRDLASAPSEGPEDETANSANHVSTPIALVVIVGAIVVFGWFGGLFSLIGSDSTGRAVLPQGLGAPPPVVTKGEYDQLREGMTYQQVRQIIGAAGEELSRSDLVGITTVMYSWTNSNGSNMNAMFQDDRMVQKAQFGLP